MVSARLTRSGYKAAVTVGNFWTGGSLVLFVWPASVVRKKDKRRWESRTLARHKRERERAYMRKAGSTRWKGVWQLTKEALHQQAQSPLPGDESEIGRDRGLVKTVTLVAINSSVIKE